MLFTIRGIVAIVLTTLAMCAGIELNAADTKRRHNVASPSCMSATPDSAQLRRSTDIAPVEQNLYVGFDVNRSDLGSQARSVALLTDSVIPGMRANGLALSDIYVRGAASPEGPYLNNVSLAQRRAEAVARILGEALADPDAPNIHTLAVAEDYETLLDMLESHGDGAAPVLRRIISRHGPDNPEAIKADLQQAAGGRIWERLLRDYFPKLRATQVSLLFAQIADTTVRFMPAMASVCPPGGGRPIDWMPTQAAPAPLASIAPPQVWMERRHMLALSSNLLYDIFYMPGFGWAPMLNIQAEFFPKRGNFSFVAGFTAPYYHRWSKHKFFQIRDYHLEVRRWFNPGLLNTGLYAALYLNANKYGIGLGADRGWQGEGAGAALKVGYTLPLGSGRWRLDFHAAAGGYWTRFDPYVYGNPVSNMADGKYYYDYTGPADSFNKRSHHRWWLGPTEVGVTLTFDLLYHRIRHGGASMRRKEVVAP